jgi:hypothetical protein
MSRLRLEKFAEETGILPATGERAELLERLSKAAYDLIKVVEVERCGVRDGDGSWHGTDVLGGSCQEVGRVWSEIRIFDEPRYANLVSEQE